MEETENSLETFGELEEQPTGKRWDPLGAANDYEDFERESSSYEHYNHTYCDHSTIEKIQCLEEEQELLNSSLIALTTHFAQVQFRLRQVVNAPSEDKEDLLKSLEEFAFRGIPDVAIVQEQIDDANLAEAVRLKRNQQKELIERLKNQLRELEQYAFDTGDAGVPQQVVLERQRSILNELKNRMNLDIDEDKYHEMTPADVKMQINSALDHLVSPLKVKEHLVAQLKTQVDDLERFISYLQKDNKNSCKNKCSCGCSYHSITKPHTKTSTLGMIEKTAALLHIFAVLQMGCGPPTFRKNEMKSKVFHWGDLRAKLEVSISHVKDLILKTTEPDSKVRSTTDFSTDSETHLMPFNLQVTTAVRKYLAPSLRDLLQHGATLNANSASVVPFIGCFPRRAQPPPTQVHAWEIILEYYHYKNGEKYNSTPARKLSQSFNLDIAGSSPVNNKQTLLSVIGSIISTHTPYKRSQDSHFKAFVCAALNANKLVQWLGLILQCTPVVKMYYLPWSYVAKTGFKDSLASLDGLSSYSFDLPVDFAVRQFANIKDIFT